MEDTASRPPERATAALAAVLAIAAAAVYARTGRYGYVPLDDYEYVGHNGRVLAGLSLGGVRWAFTTFEQGNWHPLTWLSHMLDATLFGAAPGRFHLVNVAIHAATAALLFLAFRRMTGAPWRSAAVGAVFALHPLHVESVAWISERKDVLSALFFAALLLAWTGWVRRGGPGRYLLALAFLALGLLSKPMLVTAPFVLLLLDVWPLGRTPICPAADGSARAPVPTARLLAEKAPFLALAAASSVVTYVAQRAGGAMVMSEGGALPLAARAVNAIVSYAAYLGKAVWPATLAVFYPYPTGGIAAWRVVAAGALLAALCAAAAWQLRRRAFLAVGLCWFLGMLVPVIGLVQVGAQAMADRYAHLPLVGVSIAVAWLAGEIAGRSRAALLSTASAAAGAFAALAAATVVQIGYWRDAPTLFRRAIAVTENNWLAYNSLGIDAYEHGRRAEALEMYLAALRINPGFADAHHNLALVLGDTGQLESAVKEYRFAIRISPRNARFRNNLANALARLGRRAEAIEQYQEALRLRPDYALAAQNLRILTEGR